MSKKDVANKLKELKDDFLTLLMLFDSPKNGMNKKENIDFISQEYTVLKERINDKLLELEKRDKNAQLSQIELAFLLPAIKEISLHCKARKGSKNKSELSSSIYDGQDYCTYWISQLNV